MISAAVATALMALATLYALASNFRLWKFRCIHKLELERCLHLEKQLVEKQNFLRAIIQTEPECVKLLSSEGVVLDINPAGASLVDAESPEQMLGTCIYNVVIEPDKDRYRALTDSVFRGESGTLEFRIESHKGHIRWMETHAVPMRDSAGNIFALLGITRDITARKQAEEDSQRHQSELARVCRMVTVNEMATTLAHELNQPLCAITSYMESLRNLLAQGEGVSLPRLREIAGKTVVQAERAGRIIHRVREFASTQESGMLSSQINTLIEDVIGICNAEAGQRGVTICMQLGDDLPPVLADPIQIQQVVLNLVRNAIEAMDELPAEFGRLVVSTRLSEAGMVEVCVQDNGCGLPDAEAERVFTPFFTTKPQGMGMGLSISSTIVKAHGGHLSLQANPFSRGSTARFALPVFDEALQ